MTSSLKALSASPRLRGEQQQRRFLCLYFPRWPIQRLLQAQPELRGKPVALYERDAHGPRLAACSPEAGAVGARRGMPAPEATALSPGLLLLEIDRERDRAALEKLALWAGRFSPSTGIEPQIPGVVEHPQSILIEITGCEQVFHGEENLLRLVRQGLAQQHLKARIALAPTVGAAWALSHVCVSGNRRQKAEGGKQEADDGAIGAAVDCLPPSAFCLRHTALAPLPIRALRLPPEAVAGLNRLGVQTIGELLAQPRAALPSRFGPEIIACIDRALGSAAEVFPWLRPPPEIFSAQAFEYALTERELLLRVIAQRLGPIVRELRRRCRGARALQCWLYREAADPVLLDISLFQASAAKKHLLQLIRTRLEDLPCVTGAPAFERSEDKGSCVLSKSIEADAGFCAVSVWVTASEPLSAEQLALFSKPRGAPSGLALTLDRIRIHCGADTVMRVAEVEDAQPEHAWGTESRQPAVGASQARNPKHEIRNKFQNRESKIQTTTTDSAAISSKYDADVLKFEFSKFKFVSDFEIRASCLQRRLLPTRPCHLLPNPAPVRIDWPAGAAQPCGMDFKGEHISIRRASGPERIETGWWRPAVSAGRCDPEFEGAYVRRDYYTLDAVHGSRYWIFRRLNDGQWFLQGIFD